MGGTIYSYHIFVYGGPTGFGNNRAQITLFSTTGAVLAFLKFKGGGTLAADSVAANGIITMNLPLDTFQSVVDILRNETPLHIYFSNGTAFFANASTEPVGEGED